MTNPNRKRTRIATLSAPRLTDYQLQALEHLARYHFLSKRQLLHLGVTTEQGNLSKRVIKPLVSHKLIHCIDQGYYITALTPQGANTVEKELGYPPGSVSQFRLNSDTNYTHRLQCVDFRIALDTYCHRQGKDVTFCYCDYENASTQPGRFVSRLRKYYTDTLYTEADLEFQTHTRNTGNRNLYVLEMHRHHRAGRIHDQLAFHSASLKKQVIQNHYRFPAPPLILSLYEQPATMKTVFSRVQSDRRFAGLHPYFCFGVLDEVLADISHAWTFLDPALEGTSPFPARNC